MLKAQEITKELIEERVGGALKKHVGRGMEYTADEFAAQNGAEERTVDSWRRKETAPHLFMWARAGAILPPTFSAELLDLMGLSGVREATGGSVHPSTLQISVCEMSAMLARHMVDGRQDHRERAEAEPAMRQLRAMIDAYLAGGCDCVRVPINGVVK